jgi:hypothetical protein
MEAFAAALRNAGIEAGNIDVSLPSKNGSAKQYNGADCWYWLKDRSCGFENCFCNVTNIGRGNNTIASSLGGCVPAFRTA